MSKIILNQTAQAPTAPAVGKATITLTTTNKVRITDSDGNSFIFEESSVYGSNSAYTKDQYYDTNTSTNYSTYTGLIYEAGLAVAGQKYEIEFSAIVNYSTASRNIKLRVALDGNTLEEEISVELKDTGTDVRVPMGYKYIVDGSVLNNAGGFVDFDFRSQQNGDTAKVYSATVTFKRIS